MTILFPFINNMMEHVLPPDTPRARIGSYSGFVESVFSFASFLCMYQWGKFSDTRGRKPVVLCGLVGISGSLVMLGLSRTYPMVLLARILSELNLLSRTPETMLIPLQVAVYAETYVSSNNSSTNLTRPQASVLRAALGEITTQESENWAYPLWSIGWDLSIIIGPLVGATLSQPAEQYPRSWIGRNAFLREFPFFLPCAAAAGYALLCVVLISVFFEEVSLVFDRCGCTDPLP
jgi:MFS family permease